MADWGKDRMIYRMISRILGISGKYKNRIRVAFVFSILNVLLSKMPIFYSMIVIWKISEQSMQKETVWYISFAMVITLILQIITQHISDRLQSGAGYLLFADKRLELGEHLKKLPMGYFTEGNIGKISSVLSSDMLFIEENVMAKLANIMTYIFSTIGFALFYVYVELEVRNYRNINFDNSDFYGAKNEQSIIKGSKNASKSE